MIGIQVVSHAGAALEGAPAATFDEAGGDIGRGADCTLVLPDPERRISRRQLMVEWHDGQHFVRQLGANLMVQVNDMPLALGIEHALQAGAEIRVGPYLLRCHEVAGAAAQAPAADTGEPRTAEVQELDLVIGNTTPFAPAATAEPAPHDAIAALYAGLGLAAPGTSAQTPEQLRLIGDLLRTAIEGTLALLAARTIAKRELGDSPTLLQTRKNNPLKFSPDAHVALSYLLAPPQRGFLDPLDAVNEAFDNLRAHEVAVLAGMRAGLDEVLARFNPRAIEKRMAPKPTWDALLPTNRKAKLWEYYGEHYAQISHELEGDFDSLFGRAFLQAYRKQLAQLAQEPSVDDG